MCGRFTLTKSALELIEELPGFDIDPNVQPRYNIAPNQPLLTLLNDGSNKTTFTQWGLVPHWAKDPKIGCKMINARSETLRDKPSFKMAYKRKRCLIPADGYYEWKSIPGQKIKQPMYFRMKNRRSFMLAGLWDEWHNAEGSLLITSTLITTVPNELSRPIHDRMPVILPPRHYAAWMDPELDDYNRLDDLLKPYAADEMEVYPVTTRVNSPRHDDIDCLARVGEQGDLFA